MAIIVKRNVAFARTASEVELRQALLDAACHRSSDRLIMVHEVEVASQFYALHSALTRPGRKKIERALVGATLAWDVTSDGLEALEQLVLAAGYIRCSDVIEAVRVLISDSYFQPNSSRRARESLKQIFSVLGGLAPASKSVLQFAFYDRRFDAQFSAILLNGLCLCRPQDYPQYLCHFWEVVKRVPAYYDIPAVIGELIENVRPPVIIEHLSQLEEHAEVYEHICSALSRGRRKVTVTKRGVIALRDDSAGAVIPFVPHSAPAMAGISRAALDAAKASDGTMNKYFARRARELRIA